MMTLQDTRPVEVGTYDDDERSTLSNDWSRHRRLLAGLSDQNEAGWRGCFGLAMLFDSQFTMERQRMLVPNSAVRWVSMVDLPQPSMGIRRAVHFATVYRANLFCGQPKIDHNGVVHTYDFNTKPGESIDVRMLRVLNSLNDAMTSHAFCHRDAWQRWHQKFAEYAGLSVGEKVILAGSQLMRFKPSDCRNIVDFLPEPLIRIHSSAVGNVWNRLTYGGTGYAFALRDAFCRAAIDGLAVHSPIAGTFTGTSPGLPAGGVRMTQLNFRDRNSRKRYLMVTSGFQLSLQKGSEVSIGTVVGHESLNVVSAFKHWRPAKRWQYITSLMRRNVFDVVLRTWFDSQVCSPHEDGTVLLPVSLVGRDNAYAQDGELWWDVAPACHDDRWMFNEKAEAFVFPPVPMSGWDAFMGTIGDAVEYDLTPFSTRFRKANIGRRDSLRAPTFRDGNTGDPGAETVPVVLDPELPLAEPVDDADLERIALAALKRNEAKRRQRKGIVSFPAGTIVLDDELDTAMNGNQ